MMTIQVVLSIPKMRMLINYADPDSFFGMLMYDGGGCQVNFAEGQTYDTNWHYVSAVFSTNDFRQYVDGSALGTPDTSGSFNIDSCLVHILGNSGTAFNGMMGEFRLTSSNRSGDWIATEYANQNSPSTFWTAVSSRRIFLIS